jgi:UDP-N-acetylglucosamine acyltransferase
MHQFSRIGKHCMIAGGTMIRKDVPPYTLAGRDPMSYVGINSRGLRRRGFTPEQLNRIQEIYRVIFLSKLNISQGIKQVQAQFEPSAERELIVQFIRDSERGIMRGYAFMDKNASLAIRPTNGLSSSNGFHE